jgi:MHS family shikimate/dehydroshikimate transporter-like MFS transporter
MNNTERKIILGSSVGTAFEWYDFFIYGAAASLVFNKVFFPASDPIVGMLLALLTYAMGIVARPIGGIIFGNLGDTKGRRYALTLSTGIMGACTLLIGLLPTYDMIGVWAAVLLIVVRLVQGLAFGGEFGAAALMIYENVPENKKGLYGSFIQIGEPIGLLLSSITFLLLSQLPQEDFLLWGWRIPFIASVLLILIGYYIRRQLPETQEFNALEQSKKTARTPVWQLITKYPRALFLTAGAKLSEVTLSYMVTLFLVSYAVTSLNVPRQLLINGLIYASIANLFMMPFFGYLSDKIGSKPLIYASCIFTLVAAFPLWTLIHMDPYLYLVPVIILCMVFGNKMTFAVWPNLMPRLFPVAVRTSGVGLASQLSAGVGGGLMPVVFASLVLAFDGTTGISIILCACAVISIICTWMVKEVKEQ